MPRELSHCSDFFFSLLPSLLPSSSLLLPSSSLLFPSSSLFFPPLLPSSSSSSYSSLFFFLFPQPVITSKHLCCQFASLPDQIAPEISSRPSGKADKADKRKKNIATQHGSGPHPIMARTKHYLRTVGVNCSPYRARTLWGA